jgi:hypothetical protein
MVIMTEYDDAVAQQLQRGMTAVNSRFIALAIYGMLGILVGLAMTATGAPGRVEEAFGPWIRLILGATAFAGGVMTMIGNIGSTNSRRSWALAFAGLNLLAIWGFTMAGVYFASALKEGFMVAWPWQDLPPDSGRLYVPLLYECLFFLFLLHVVTLVRLRPRRPVH